MKYLSLFPLLLLTACAASTLHVTTPSPLRGVWLTNVASEVLNSRENIDAAVALCDSLGFTDIYVVTWNNATTTFPSRTVETVTGVAIQPEFAGRDPLAEVIEAAHARDIRVHAWFEFGFSCAYRDSTGGPLIAARPHWAARDTAGQLATKNGFQWMNAFHPEVQGFISDLILEVVSNYDIDGIQGDDRLPALPSLAGYSAFTDSLYRSEHGGSPPPRDIFDADWVDWRSRKMSAFLTGLCPRVRAQKPDIIISMAPSIYPWSKEQYLQDWPDWINGGTIDYVVPQVYRYDHDRYAAEIEKIVSEQVDKDKIDRVFPGILLQVDTYNPSVGFLDSMIVTNRQNGLNGEVHFFYEGLPKFRDYFRGRYLE